MSPDTRQKLHDLLDQALDVIAEEKDMAPRKRKARALTLRNVPVDEATIGRAVTAARKAGLL